MLEFMTMHRKTAWLSHFCMVLLPCAPQNPHKSRIKALRPGWFGGCFCGRLFQAVTGLYSEQCFLHVEGPRIIVNII